MVERLILSLILTLILEILYALGWKVHGKDLLIILWMNLLTNPMVVIYHHFTADAGYLISTLLPELSAIAAEAYILKRFSNRIHFPVLLAVCINVFSYVCGVIISYFIY